MKIALNLPRPEKRNLLWTAAMMIILTSFLNFIQTSITIRGFIVPEAPGQDVVLAGVTFQKFAPTEALIIHPTLVFRLLAPFSVPPLDILYGIYFAGGCLISYFFFGDAAIERPFTAKAVMGIYTLTAFTLLFLLFDAGRFMWLGNELLRMSGGKYSYQRSAVEMPECWIFFVLVRMIFFFRKGRAIQQETELTV